MQYEDYWVEDNTLIIRGNFFGISTGLLGGWKKVSFVFNHTVNDDFHLRNPVEYLIGVAENLKRRYGLKSYFGLLTSVPMDNLCISSCGEVTAFVTAGVKNPNERVFFGENTKNKNVGTINIIAVFDCRLSRGAMLNAIITSTEAKTKALLESGYDFTGTNTDAVIILSTQKGRYHRYAGPHSEVGRDLWEAVGNAVAESLNK